MTILIYKHNRNKMDSKYYIEKSVVIISQPASIFKILKDVEHWHVWTNSIIGISLLADNTFKKGAKIKLLQPKLKPAVWTISEIVENKSLQWEKKSFGLKVIANHLIEKSNEGSIVKLQVIFQGFWARLIYKLSFPLTNKYLEMEIRGLKIKCEGLN